jgi:predicted XRE-type DNA-binding protein
MKESTTAAKVELANDMRNMIQAYMEEKQLTNKEYAEQVNVPLPQLRDFLRSKTHSNSIVYVFSQMFFDHGCAPKVSFEEVKKLLAEDMRSRIKGSNMYDSIRCLYRPASCSKNQIQHVMHKPKQCARLVLSPDFQLPFHAWPRARRMYVARKKPHCALICGSASFKPYPWLPVVKVATE